jgi:hypothetical protein
MSYKKVVAGSLGVVAALGVFATFGFAPGYALDTDGQDGSAYTNINVKIEEECGMSGGSNMTFVLTSSTPSAELRSTDADVDQFTPGNQAGSPLYITCNNTNGWTLSYGMGAGGNYGLDQYLEITNGSGIGFGPWSAGAAVSGFAANTWGAKYAKVDGTTSATITLTPAAAAYHAVPSAKTTLVTSNGASAGTEVDATVGIKTDGSLGAGTYTGSILYTLLGTN